MKKGEKKLPLLTKVILGTSLGLYLWYFISTLILPLSEFVHIPDFLMLTFYKMLDFPISLIGFIICVSILSCLLILLQFGKQNEPLETFLIDGTTFSLFFIIPIVATILLLILIVSTLSTTIPNSLRLSYFLEDLFLFTGFLFLLTLILNFATKKLLLMGKCCELKKPN